MSDINGVEEVPRSLPSAHPDVPDMNDGNMEPSRESDTEITRCSHDTISRKAAIDALNEQIEQCNKALGSFDISLKDEFAIKVERASLEAYKEQLENLPSVQPEITHEQAIDYLHETGWLQNHDRILTESKIVPPVQPNHNADPDKKADAIPVEWIAKYMRSIKSGTFADPAWIIKTMLEEWREE